VLAGPAGPSPWRGKGELFQTASDIFLGWTKGPEGTKLKVRLAELGGTVLPGSPRDFGKLIAEETEKWGKVVRAANVKVE
jgi:hypothetical protein